MLKLIVLEPRPGTRAYGVEVPCQIYGGFEEMIYSVAKHGDESNRYDGGPYIKEAESSRLLETWVELDPINRKPRHFLFVGSDFYYETVGFGTPSVRTFTSREEAYEWNHDQT